MATTLISPHVWPSNAIPIPKPSRLRLDNDGDNKNNNAKQSNSNLSQPGYPTTPSLQSIIDQKKFSNGSIKSNVSSNSMPSLISTSSSYESCDSHPLDSFNTWDDIDENFFCQNDTSFNDDYDNNYTFQPLSPIEPVQQQKYITKKASFVSNLSSSIKSFANSTRHNNDILFDIQPRLTDDKLPKNIIQKHRDTELQTFKVTSKNSSLPTSSSTSTPSISILGNREPRINSQFLRLYSYESNSRKKGILPEVTHLDEEDYLQRQQSSSPISNSLDPNRDFAMMVRQRLWQCVVLPPREDLNLSSNPEYVYAGESVDENNEDQEEFVSLIRKKGNVKPWIKLEDEEISKMKVLRPCGVLNNDTQFTVKGWCNERWLPRS